MTTTTTTTSTTTTTNLPETTQPLIVLNRGLTPSLANATEQTVPLTTVAVVVVSVNTTDVTEDAQPQSTQPIMIEPAKMTTQTPVVVKETTEK